MKSIITFALALVFTGGLYAQTAGPSPAELRLREQIKTLTQRMTAAETAQVALQSEKAALEEDLKKQKAAYEGLVKTTTAEKDTMKGEAEKLTADIADREKQIAEIKTELGKANTNVEKASIQYQKTEAERARLANESVVLKRIVSDQRLKNSQMYATAKEILEKFTKFGFGTALTSREQVIGITRARLESYFEDYSSQLSKHRIRLDGTTPASSTPTASKDRPSDAKPAEKKPAEKKAPAKS
jgi:chromosome segregation ATPase